MERTISIVEHVLFWILILAIIATVIWLAFGSPEFEKSLLMVMIFVAGSELLLWKTLFATDKKSSIGFERVKIGFERVRSDFKQVNIRLDIMGSDITGIKDNFISIENNFNGVKNRLINIETDVNNIKNSILKINKKLK